MGLNWRFNYFIYLSLNLLLLVDVYGQKDETRPLPTLSEFAKPNLVFENEVDLKPNLEDQHVVYSGGQSTVLKSRNDTVLLVSVKKVELNLFEVQYRYKNIDHFKDEIFPSVLSSNDYMTENVDHKVVGSQIRDRESQYQRGVFYFVGPYPDFVEETPRVSIFIDGFIFQYNWEVKQE